LGFQVTTLIDATKEKMFGAIRDFGKELARGGVGLFFYAGHGMQVRGANYLIPIGADIQSEDEVPFQAVDASLVLSKMESAGNRVNIVILDACRDNPFAMSFRSTGRGLSVVEAPRGSLVVYATAPGSVAAEGQGQNGVFTAALLRNIRTPGIDAELTLRKVRQEVMYDTVNAQVPWTSSSLTGSFYFAGKGADTEPATAGEQAAPATQPAASAPERKPILLVEKAYGSVTIEVRTAGELYLNGEAMGSLTPGSSARLDDLEAGKANLEMRYRDGNRESRTVEVPTNGVAAVSFSYVERPKAFENMVLVEGGTFHMGDTFGNGDSDEKPVHPVTVSSFFLGKCEVTQREWREVMGSNPLKFKGDDLPVENVCWYDAAEYCNKLSKRKGLEPCYTISGDNVSCDFSRNGFRLPTEAEWEFAARGGVRSSGYKYSGGNNLDAVAWYDRNSGGTHPVGGKQANEIGLYDMSGNVWEWCWDWYGPYPSGSQTDPMGASSGQYRVLRGGSWDDFVRGARASNRYWDAPGFRDSGSGFRVAARAP
jgi:formylglycine-generating enzyme required for sulfatase activity